MSETANSKKRHFTARPGFTIFVGLLVLALYIMWAAYGAAPTSLGFLTEARDQGMAGAAPGGHG